MTAETGPRRRLALVTGTSAGLGAAFARAYAARGLDVALVARRADRLEALAATLRAEHQVQALVIPADLAAWEAHEGVLKAIAEAGRVVDVLVNNAGFGIPQSFAAVPWSRQRDFLMTMAVAPCGLAHGVIPGMVERGAGSIVNIASLAAFSPGVAGNSLYPGVKGLMLTFSQSLDAEYRDEGAEGHRRLPRLHQDRVRRQGRHPDGDRQGAAAALADRRDGGGGDHPRQRAGPGGAGAGLAQQAGGGLMRGLPPPLVRSMISAGSAKYHPED